MSGPGAGAGSPPFRGVEDRADREAGSIEAPVERPYVSVIIPTLHREEPLRRVLAFFLEAETYSPFEVIVVDQSEKHEPATVEFLDAIGSRIRLARITQKGAANARNHGAGMAAGSILVFVDDDDLPRVGFISGHVAGHQNAEIAAVCGAVLRPGASLRTMKDVSPEELARIRAHRSAPRDVDFSFECSWGSTSNLSVKTEWFWKVGGFYSRENAGVASGGLHDALFGHSLRHAGGRILYSPLPTVVMGQAETGGCRDVADYPQRRVLEIENALNFWSRIHSSRRRAIQITFRQVVIRRSVGHIAKNLWFFIHALARWSRSSE